VLALVLVVRADELPHDVGVPRPLLAIEDRTRPALSTPRRGSDRVADETGVSVESQGGASEMTKIATLTARAWLAGTTSGEFGRASAYNPEPLSESSVG
jgi:hypothetical protein